MDCILQRNGKGASSKWYAQIFSSGDVETQQTIAIIKYGVLTSSLFSNLLCTFILLHLCRHSYMLNAQFM